MACADWCQVFSSAGSQKVNYWEAIASGGAHRGGKIGRHHRGGWQANRAARATERQLGYSCATAALSTAVVPEPSDTILRWCHGDHSIEWLLQSPMCIFNFFCNKCVCTTLQGAKKLSNATVAKN